MKRIPWVPAPCKAAAKRFPRSNLSGPRRKILSRSIKKDNHGDKIFRDKEEDDSNLDENLVHALTRLEGDEDGTLRMLNSLRRIKSLYFEAESKIDALKQELELCKDELLRAHLELETEKETRRSAEMRVETMSVAMRELEKVVHSQRNRIVEFHHSQRSGVLLEDKRLRFGSTVAHATTGNQIKDAGSKRDVGTLAKTMTSNSATQTVMANVKSIIDGPVSKVVDSSSSSEESLAELQSRRSLGFGKEKGSTKPRHQPKTRSVDCKQRIPDQMTLFERNMDNRVVDRGQLKEILEALRQLEEEVTTLRRSLSTQKRINLAVKEYVQLLDSAYKDLY